MAYKGQHCVSEVSSEPFFEEGEVHVFKCHEELISEGSVDGKTMILFIHCLVCSRRSAFLSKGVVHAGMWGM